MPRRPPRGNRAVRRFRRTRGPTVVFVRVNGAGRPVVSRTMSSGRRRGPRRVDGPQGGEARDAARLDALLARLEGERGLPQGQVRVLALIETARGLVRCEEIAFGRTYTPAHASSLGSATSPSTSASTSPGRDRDPLRPFARRRGCPSRPAARRAGRAVPRPPERRRARRGHPALPAARIPGPRRGLSAAGGARPARLHGALAGGDGAGRARRGGVRAGGGGRSASIQVDGRFVDYPIYERAKQQLATTGRCSPRAGACREHGI